MAGEIGSSSSSSSSSTTTTTKALAFRNAVITGDLEKAQQFAEEGDPSTVFVEDCGNSLFHYAAQYDDTKMLRFLLGLPRCVTPWWKVANARQNTPLHLAALSGSSGTLLILLEEHRQHIQQVQQQQDQQNLSILLPTSSSSSSSPQFLNNVVDLTNCWGETALHLASQSGNEDCVLLLKRFGANVELLDKWGRTAHEVGSEHFFGRVPQLRYSSSSQTKDQAHRAKDSPLSSPSISDQTSVAGVLPQKKKKPLSKMIEAPLDEERFLTLLTDEEVDPFGKDMFGLTALHKVSAWNKQGCLGVLLRLSNAPLHLCPIDGEGNTPLHHACMMGADRCVSVLLQVYTQEQIALRNKANQTAQDISSVPFPS